MDTELNIEMLLADETRVQAWLAGLVGPEPGRMAELLRWPNRNVAEIGAGIDLNPLEVAVAGALNGIGGEDGIRRFFNDYGAIAMAKLLAAKFGIVCDPDVGTIRRSPIQYHCGRFHTCLRAAIILAVGPGARAPLVDIAVAHVDEMIGVLAGRDPLLNDFLYTGRLHFVRRGRSTPDPEDAKWLRDSDFEVPKAWSISTGEKKVYRGVLQDLARRIRALADDSALQAAAARQVCEWLQVGQGRPHDSFGWYVPSPANVWLYGRELVAAVKERLDTGVPEKRGNVSLGCGDSFGDIRQVVEIVVTPGVGTAVQIQGLRSIFNRPGHGRRRDWLFDAKKLGDISRATIVRYRELATIPKRSDVDDAALETDAQSRDPDESPRYDVAIGSLDSAPFARFANQVCRQDPEALYYTDLTGALARDLAQRFALQSVGDGYMDTDWRNPGRAYGLFRTSLQRAVRLTPDTAQRELVVDIAIDHVARVWDKFFELWPYEKPADFRLFMKLIWAEQRSAAPRPDSVHTEPHGDGSDSTEVFHEHNLVLDPDAGSETAGVNPVNVADAAGPRSIVWFPPEDARLARKEWVWKIYPDADLSWWADLEDGLVNDLLALDDNPWVVQRVARETAGYLESCSFEEPEDLQWIGFSPPEILRQSMLSLRAMSARLDRVRDRGASQFILDVAPYLARMYDILERPDVMTSFQAARLNNMFWIALNGPVGLRLAEAD